MKLRNPYRLENLNADQPYFSFYLIANNCAGVCNGCHNKELLEHEVIDFSVDWLVNEYKSNFFVEGITVAGLEIFDSGKDFIKDLLLFIEQANIKKVTIYTRYEFYFQPLQELISGIKRLGVNELYIKYGKYIEGLPAKKVNIGKWSLTLASENQEFIRVV